MKFNKIVYELAKKAQIIDPMDESIDEMPMYEIYELYKFTELLVREAIKIADKHGAYEVMDDLFDHFGVKDEK